MSESMRKFIDILNESYKLSDLVDDGDSAITPAEIVKLIANMEDPEPDPEQQAYANELRMALKNAINKLPPRNKQVLKLYAADPDQSMRAIGQQMQPAVGSAAVSVHLQTAFRRMRADAALRQALGLNPSYKHPKPGHMGKLPFKEDTDPTE